MCEQVSQTQWHLPLMHKFFSVHMTEWEVPYYQLIKERKGQSWVLSKLAWYMSAKQKEALTTLELDSGSTGKYSGKGKLSKN